MWSVEYLPGADDEFAKLSAREQVAVTNAVKKLQALGSTLPFPHSSDARGLPGVRELRPRGGNSPTRPLYRRIRDRFFIGAIGPDGGSDPRGFAAACERAAERLREKERELGNE
jgi:hypothetical protein